MPPPLRLTSLDNPRIKQVIHLRKPRDRRESGLFVAEGRREIRRAMAAGLRLADLFWSPEHSETAASDLVKVFPGLKRNPDARLCEVLPHLLEKMAYLERPEGFIALFHQPEWKADDLPRGTADWAELYLVAAGTEKPGNLGAMVRSADAVGATAVFAADADVDPFNPNAIRASTGAVFTMPVISAGSAEVIAFLKQRDVRIAVATPEAKRPYTALDLRLPTALVIGAEDRGVDAIWRDAGEAIGIPMRGKSADSLNASTSAAILLFEAMRQRT